jgi:exodeoxyribonuclease V alpha subunit
MTPTVALAGAEEPFRTLAEELGRAAEDRDAGSIQLAVEFARSISRMAGSNRSIELLAGAALASLRVSSGHSCADLGAFWEAQPPTTAQESQRPIGADDALRGCLPEGFTLEAWREELLRNPGIVSPPPADDGPPRSPLVLDSANRLYLARYWVYEREVARELVRRSKVTLEVDEAALETAIVESFGPIRGDDATPEAGPDLQRVAAVVAATRSLCVLSGGPGTGKTSTVVRILAVLSRLRLVRDEEPLRIRLAAPTGKAAARMKESVEKARGALPEELQGPIPDQALTIHRLLGWRSGSIYFRHDEERKLPYDVLVVDEASMVDLPLMAKILRALPEEARLVLVGDKDQLASVEAGSVLGDLCSDDSPDAPRAGGSRAGLRFSAEARARYGRLSGQSLPDADAVESGNPLRDSIVMLDRNYRFERDGGIYRLAEAVRRRSTDEAFEVLTGGKQPGAVFVEVETASELASRIESRVPEACSAYLDLANSGSDSKLFEAFNRFRLLCAVRQGDFGVERVNVTVANVLAKKKMITRRGEWYVGRPIMVTRNDYSLNLFNGDVGILLSQDGRDQVRFEDGARKGQSLAPARLPAHETVFALTVHKSQGSEFDDVVVILPPKESRILGRELLYTAITRARKSIEIWGTKDALRKSIETRLARSSGLADAIRTMDAEVKG